MTNISFFHNIYSHFFSFHAISAFLHFLINLEWDNDGTESVKEEWLCICFQAYENEEKWSKVLTMSLIHFFSVCYCRLCFRNVSVIHEQRARKLFWWCHISTQAGYFTFFFIQTSLVQHKTTIFFIMIIIIQKTKNELLILLMEA